MRLFRLLIFIPLQNNEPILILHNRHNRQTINIHLALLCKPEKIATLLDDPVSLPRGSRIRHDSGMRCYGDCLRGTLDEAEGGKYGSERGYRWKCFGEKGGGVT